MQQQISVITLGVTDLAACRRFYGEGFGWEPVFANKEILFYQMNGLMLGLWLQPQLEADMGRSGLARPGAFALAHNMPSRQAVDDLVARLAAHGGTILRPADAPDHGGYRGYIADPHDHAWEIAWNPAWTFDDAGHVKFGL